jgi:hypothetical protein
MTRIDLRENDMHAYTPVLLGRWTLEVPFAEVEEAVLHRYRWGGTIRLRRKDGDVTVTSIGGNCAKIAGLLREKGIRVAGDRGGTDTSG